ncbi:ABC transporter permease [Mangrovihabitans endophyticus]|uniref:ABC transporter permease n=1 Tax=Mangrovihabitans endophyticus TaxID=1751298 RepID=A0A8J3FMA3_9ACTN|nr:ABC transporter permease [Mangrovihabitans endophyticus]GGK74418.1 ABC transporter permease [Mangrovihabitans endophyticus]
MDFYEYLKYNAEPLFDEAVGHVRLVAISIGIALVVGCALGVLAHRSARTRPVILAVSSTLLTIPSLALFALAIPLLGLGTPPAVVALVLYALLPIVRNTVVGLASVDQNVLRAARGMGIGSWRRFARIELPLAWPVVLAGVRVSTQIVVGIAAIGALVNGPGLGNEIFRGLRSLGSPFALNFVLGGTLGIVVVALLFDAMFILLRRFTTARGIR